MRAETTLAAPPAAAGAARSRPGLFARRRHRELLLIWLLLAPALLIFLVFRVIPLLWNLALSFQFWSPMKPAEWAGLFHYEEMLVYDDVFWTALENTFVYMLTAPIAILIALGLALVEDLCAGLANAHDARIVHRDIKPDNIMVDRQGVVKLLDFGIARSAARCSTG